MKKILSFLLALTLCLSLFGCTAKQDAPAENMVIPYTNDVHTYIDGPLSYDVIAGLKKELQKTYPRVILVDAGDHI